MFIKVSELTQIALAEIAMPIAIFSDAQSAKVIADALDAELTDTASFAPRQGQPIVVDCQDAVNDDMDRKREIYRAIELAEITPRDLVVFVFRQNYELGAATTRVVSFVMRPRGRPSRVDNDAVLAFLKETYGDMDKLPRGAKVVAAKKFGLTRARVSQIVAGALEKVP